MFFSKLVTRVSTDVDICDKEKGSARRETEEQGKKSRREREKKKRFYEGQTERHTSSSIRLWVCASDWALWLWATTHSEESCYEGKKEDGERGKLLKQFDVRTIAHHCYIVIQQCIQYKKQSSSILSCSIKFRIISFDLISSYPPATQDLLYC